MAFPTGIVLDPAIEVTDGNFAATNPAGVFDPTVVLNPTIEVTDGEFAIANPAGIFDDVIALNPVIELTDGVFSLIPGPSTFRQGAILRINARRLYDEGDDARELDFIIDEVNVDFRQARVYPDSAGNPSDLRIYAGALSDREIQAQFKFWRDS